MGKPAKDLLLQVKLHPPVSGRILVQRPRLEEWISSAKHAKLVLVRAPAGFGKTTLMVQWINHLKAQGQATAWLSLDPADNDSGRFMSYLCGAIEKGAPELKIETSNLDDWGSASFSGGMLFLVDQLANYPKPFTLFLDDFGSINDAEITELMRQLLLHLPPNKCIVMGMRRLPEIGLGKIRARGELVDIDIDCLRFSHDETEFFIRQTQGLSTEELDKDTVALLQNLTEGWVAGLQLSTLSSSWLKLAESSEDALIGNFAKFSEYLAEDVLEHQSEEIQEFLLQTSVLGRLNGSLCDALTGRFDGYQMLEYLEKANLFLMPLDEDRRWYRYHSLFAKFLRRRLDLTQPGRLKSLCRVAAEWYAQQGDYHEATQQALAAGDHDAAAVWLEKCAVQLTVSGQIGQILEVGNNFLPQDLRRFPLLMLAYAYALSFRHDYEKAFEVIDKASSVRNAHPGYQNDLLLLKALIFWFQDRISEAAGIVTNDFLTSCKVNKPLAYGTVQNLLGVMMVAGGKPDAALEYFGQGNRIAQKDKDSQGGLFNKYHEGVRELGMGHLQGALSICSKTHASTENGPMHYSLGGTAIAVLLAETLYASNELKKAEKILTQYSPLLSQTVLADVSIVGYRTRARLHAADGNFAGAMSCLTEAERLGAERGLQRLVASSRLELSRLALLRGDLVRAEQVFKVCSEDKVWSEFEGWYMSSNDPETLQINRLRLMIELGQAEEAIKLLRIELSKAEESSLLRRALLVRILMSKAYEVTGQRGKALRALKKAVFFAQEEGFIRIFVDEGEVLASLVADLVKTTTDMDRELSSEYLKRLLMAMGYDSAAGAVSHADLEESLVEALTEREMKILELVAQGLSNEEMGERLYVSKHTVRSHLRNIHSKLGAKNRTEAVSLARRYGFIR